MIQTSTFLHSHGLLVNPEVQCHPSGSPGSVEAEIYKIPGHVVQLFMPLPVVSVRPLRI